MLTRTSITLGQYLGPYIAHPDATATVLAHASELLRLVNEVYAQAAIDGCELPDNPATGCGVSGSGNGGFRPGDCTVGAKDSTHKTGQGIDRYDPHRQFASWCLAHPQPLIDRGLHMEDPRWTPTWVHLQSVPPKSGRVVYVPSSAPALAAAPKDWETLA